MSSVKIAELSQRSGVSVPTLKYYLRLGLMSPGQSTAKNQADYVEAHVKRIRLIRSLTEFGHLRIADVTLVLAAVDDESVALHDAFGAAQDAMVPKQQRDTPEYEQAAVVVEAFVRRHRLKVRADAAIHLMLADAVVVIATEFSSMTMSEIARQFFDPMVSALRQQSEFEIASVPLHGVRASIVEYTVIGTVGFELAANAIRRMALEHYSAKRFGKVVNG